MSKIRCACCGQIAESKHRHDFVRLDNCPNETFVDGGNDYIRCGGKDMSLIEVFDPSTGEFYGPIFDLAENPPAKPVSRWPAPSLLSVVEWDGKFRVECRDCERRNYRNEDGAESPEAALDRAKELKWLIDDGFTLCPECDLHMEQFRKEGAHDGQTPE